MQRQNKKSVKAQIAAAQDIKHLAESMHTSVKFHQQPVQMLLTTSKTSPMLTRLKNYSRYKTEQLQVLNREEAWTELARQSMNYLYYTSYLIALIEEEQTGKQAAGIFKKTARINNILNQESLKY